MKDFNDIETVDFAETGCSFTREAIASCGYYQALKTPTCKEISGRRYKGTNTPDAVRDLWSTPREVIAYLEGVMGNMISTLLQARKIKFARSFTPRKQTA